MTSATPEEPIGLRSGTVRVVPYDPRWPALYDTEAARVRTALASHGRQIRLEHTGSTAVPGLAAKPIIDILAGRSPDASRDAIVDALREAGYSYRGEQGIPGRDFFRRGEPRSYHLHLVEVGSDFWHDHRAFRDHLRQHPDVAARYAALKLELARRFPTDRAAYIEGKTVFVLDVLAEAKR